MRRGGRKTIVIGDPCIDCGVALTIENGRFGSLRLYSRCKECLKKENARKYLQVKDANKGKYLERKFGISPEDYERKKELQLGGCAICKQPCSSGRELAVDHDHGTGKIRDLLCTRCNNVLGLLHEDEDLIFAILEYLKRRNIEKVA